MDEPANNPYVRDPSLEFEPIDDLAPETARRQAELLREAIGHHDHRYYQLADPIVSDRTYDALFERLLELEDPSTCVRRRVPHAGSVANRSMSSKRSSTSPRCCRSIPRSRRPISGSSTAGSAIGSPTPATRARSSTSVSRSSTGSPSNWCTRAAVWNGPLPEATGSRATT